MKRRRFFGLARDVGAVAVTAAVALGAMAEVVPAEVVKPLVFDFDGRMAVCHGDVFRLSTPYDLSTRTICHQRAADCRRFARVKHCSGFRRRDVFSFGSLRRFVGEVLIWR
jgi:hypothetical protein